MLQLIGKGLDTSGAGTSEISIHPYGSVSTALAEQRGDISTSAAWITVGLEREAQLSVDVFMGSNTLGKKKKNLKKMQICFAVSNMFLSLV